MANSMRHGVKLKNDPGGRNCQIKYGCYAKTSKIGKLVLVSLTNPEKHSFQLEFFIKNALWP